MVKRHLCEYFEAGEECENDLCIHVGEDNSQYLFDNISQKTVWLLMYHLDGEQANFFVATLFHLLDVGFDQYEDLD